MFTSIDYRYPTEHRTLAITVAVMVVALLITTSATLGAMLMFLLLGFGLNYLVIRTKVEGLKRSAVRIGPTQFPEIKAIVDECVNRIGVPIDTEVYISQSPVLNAFAVGVGRPYAIVLHSALVQALDEDELRYVIGHEMGHIKFGHTGLLTLVGQLGSQTSGIPLVGDLIRYGFLFWMRATEFTADRAGLVACGRLEKAIATQLKLGVGPELASRIDLRELARQARESQGSPLGALGEMESTHPMMTTRIQKIVEFAFSDIFRRVCPDGDTSFRDAVHWYPPPTPSLTTPNVACPNCRRPLLRPMAIFCPHCGIRLRCSQCQEPVEATWKVCPRCGNRLTQMTA
ncbi:MAG: M48 family metallopeptidase [Anaerolineae bacterium]|nr:M48 family metallopeptidase [Anaerolineae bacterium]